MKVIDLLNKIAYGFEVPKKVKALDEIWIYDEEAECHKNKDGVSLYKRLDEFYIISYWLVFEVEILDEEDEFEDIEEYFAGVEIEYNSGNYEYKINQLIKNQKKIIEWIDNEKKKD